MLKHLFVDNFRTLVNFNIDLGPLTLLLGPNGAGKSTVLDVIRTLYQFTCEFGRTDELFPQTTLTRWQSLKAQTFELGLSGSKGAYVYHLELDHDLDVQRCRIKSESLKFGNQLLFESRTVSGQLRAQLYQDDGSKGMELLAVETISGIAALINTRMSDLVDGFWKLIRQVQVCRFDPMQMRARSERETPILDANASNYAGWLRHLAASDLEFAGRLRPMLEEALEGYEGLTLLPDGQDARILKVRFKSGANGDPSGRPYECRFDELSDGQRVLIVLYSLLSAARQETALCLDEPENFLALREIQPWLNALMDRAQAGDCQAILVSHHPELINALAAGHGRWLDRTAGGPTRCQPITEDGSGLPISELVARGWLNA